jgi:hypothetical protein
MGIEFSEFRNKLRLPSWQKADIEAELAAHLQEAVADLRAQGKGEAEAQTVALARFGDLGSLAESLQEIHKDWKGGATVQTRFFRSIAGWTIAICLLVFLAIPGMRQLPLVFRYLGRVGTKDISSAPRSREEAAKSYPKDIYIQVIAASSTFSRARADWQKKGLPPSEVEYKKAIADLTRVGAQFHDSPIPHLRLAQEMLIDSGGLQREEVKFVARQRPPRARNPLEQFFLDKSIEQLRLAAAVSPKDATPDYLLAYAYYADKQDPLAEQALQAALAKPDLTISDYDIKMTRARFLLDEKRGQFFVPAIFSARYTPGPREFNEYFRELARMLSGLAEAKRAAGDNAKAISYYAAGIHSAENAQQKANSFIGAMVARSALYTINNRFISREAEEDIQKQDISSEAKLEKKRSLRNRNFEAYLVANGQQALARRFAADLSEADRIFKMIKGRASLYISLLFKPFDSALLVAALLLWRQTIYVLGFALVIGGLSLAARAWKEKGQAPVWHWWEWALLLLLAVGAIQAFGLIYYHHHQEFIDLYRILRTLKFAYRIDRFALLLLLVVPIAGALWKRRRQAPEVRLGKMRACLASFRTLLLPTIAVMLLGVVILGSIEQVRLKRWEAAERQILKVGEVQYWKIGLPEK